jgi:hypothetical protein
VVRAFQRPFATGFYNPIDCKFNNDGDLIVADHTGYALIRISSSSNSRMTCSGAPRLGSVFRVDLEAADAALDHYGLFLSTANLPAYPLGSNRFLNLDVNTELFIYNYDNPANVINQFQFPDQLDTAGKDFGYITLPYYPPLLGLTIYMAWVSWDSGLSFGVTSEALDFVVLP